VLPAAIIQVNFAPAQTDEEHTEIRNTQHTELYIDEICIVREVGVGILGSLECPPPQIVVYKRTVLSMVS